MKSLGEMITMYDIEADWILDLYCNFHCSYCISRANRPLLIEGKNDILSIMRFFDSMRLCWHIHFTGGEPFLFTNFLTLCRYITKKHWISLNTNLSSDLVSEFAEGTDPKKVIFVNVGLHIIEREKLGLIEDFITKVRLLQTKGFRVFVSYVMTPNLFQRYQSDFKYFQQHDITIFPKILRTRYLGKVYPDAYTKAERILFKKFSKLAEQQSNVFQEDLETMPIIDLSLDREFIEGIPSFQGQICLAGKKFVRIWPDGSITRCDKRTVLGNLYLNKFHLIDEAKPCDTYSCPYFCIKYTKING